ncbi:MAG: M48 family metallopeptidase [Candidatus Saccharimonadales bacterium]
MPYQEFEIDGVGKIKIYKRKNNRSLRITIAADGDVRVTIPTWAPYKAGRAFASAKRDWILAQHNNQEFIVLTDGLRIGKSHHLVFKQTKLAKSIKTSVRQTEVIVTYGENSTIFSPQVQAAAQTACIRALRLQANALFDQRLSQLATLYGISYNGLTIKRMKTRWGSCDQRSNIVLNLYLVQLPWELIDYVIIHELAHVKVLHHGSRFWNELENLQPRTPQLRKEIKKYKPTLFIV